jgi:hypothetical protein
MFFRLNAHVDSAKQLKHAAEEIRRISEKPVQGPQDRESLGARARQIAFARPNSVASWRARRTQASARYRKPQRRPATKSD